MYEHYEKDCIFCSKEFRDNMIRRHGNVFAIKDNFPVTEGHLLIITSEHRIDYSDTSFSERNTTMEFIGILQRELKEKDPTITGFNIGMNCGESAGQTIMHFHTHLIPRRDGDMKDPRGGVRGVIPEKQKYSHDIFNNEYFKELYVR